MDVCRAFVKHYDCTSVSADMSYNRPVSPMLCFCLSWQCQSHHVGEMCGGQLYLSYPISTCNRYVNGLPSLDSEDTNLTTCNR